MGTARKLQSIGTHYDSMIARRQYCYSRVRTEPLDIGLSQGGRVLEVAAGKLADMCVWIESAEKGVAW